MVGVIANLRNTFRRRTAIVLSLYAAVGLFLVPLVCQWLPYSWYYFSDSHKEYRIILAENNRRVEAASKRLKSFNHTEVYSNLTSPHRTAEPDLCFIINTISRPVNTSCLTQVVSSLLPQVLNDERSIMALNNAEGSTHKEAMSLSNIVPVISNKNKINIFHSKFDKAREDYLFALQWCSRRKAKFTVIFEDDALPAQDFIFRLKFVLNNRMDSDKSSWTILKLFYPEKYQGWGNDLNLIAELIGLSIIGGVILTLLVYCCEHFTGEAQKFGWLLLISSSLFTMYLFLSMGRPHWLAIRKVNIRLSSVVTAPGCCIPATLFPHSHLDQLIEYLEGVQCNQVFPIDLALDRFADTNGLQKLLVVPNLVKHIGFVSSLPGKGWKNSKEFLVK